jgi:integration host factor subunit alpha
MRGKDLDSPLCVACTFVHARPVSLERCDTVKLSSFGSFVVRQKGPRTGRNPKTGEPVPTPPQRAVVFKPSATLRKRLAGEQMTD